MALAMARTLAFIALVTAAAALLALPTVAAPPAGEDAASLAALAADVDAAAVALADARTAARDELAALRSERAELARQVRAETARGKALDQMRREAEARGQAEDEAARRWHAPTLAAIAAARAHVEATLPFARGDRLAVLQRLDADLGAAVPDYARALERLLRFIEEEEAMGREIALTQQALTVEGHEQIVDVVRLGMALMYVRTADGRVGWVRPEADGAVELLAGEAARVVAERFAAHDANEALGLVELVLPAAIGDGP